MLGVLECIPEKGASTTGLRRPGSGGDAGRVTGSGDSIRAKAQGENRALGTLETVGGQQASGHLQVKADDAGLQAILRALSCLSQNWEQWGCKAKKGT